MLAPCEADCGSLGSAEPFGSRRRPMSTLLPWNLSTFELPGDIEDGMSGRNEQQKPGTARGSPRRSRTAKASRISRFAVKSRCAREWGGWGRLSDDGPGQHNLVSSEDPWGGGPLILQTVHHRAHDPAQYGRIDAATRCTKGEDKPVVGQCTPGVGLSRSTLPGRSRLIGQPFSRNEENSPCGMIGGIVETSGKLNPGPRHDPTRLPRENPPYGILGGTMETSASFEARSAVQRS
jgi:hypothetical protein